MVLETERLILRPVIEEDAGRIFELAKDPDVGPRAGWVPHNNIGETLYVIRNVLNGPECYAVCLKGDDEPVGICELMLRTKPDSEELSDECELGFWLGKPYWGQGIMPEAAKELIRHAFEDLGMSRIWCGHYEGNAQSARVQAKCGFRYHHTEQNRFVPQFNEYRVGINNLLTKEEWEQDQEEAAEASDTV